MNKEFKRYLTHKKPVDSNFCLQFTEESAKFLTSTIPVRVLSPTQAEYMAQNFRDYRNLEGIHEGSGFGLQYSEKESDEESASVSLYKVKLG